MIAVDASPNVALALVVLPGLVDRRPRSRAPVSSHATAVATAAASLAVRDLACRYADPDVEALARGLVHGRARRARGDHGRERRRQIDAAPLHQRARALARAGRLQRRDPSSARWPSSAPRSAASGGGWRWCSRISRRSSSRPTSASRSRSDRGSSACRPTRSPPASSARSRSSTWRRSSARDPSTLSGGQKQRLAIASILAMEPAVLLLDEPATDLDPIGRRELYAALEGVRGADLVLLAVEHEIDPVMRADRLILMKGGRIVADGPAATVARDVDLFLACGVRPARSRRARTPSRPRAAARRRRRGRDAPRARAPGAGAARRAAAARGHAPRLPPRRSSRCTSSRASTRAACTRLPTSASRSVPASSSRSSARTAPARRRSRST